MSFLDPRNWFKGDRGQRAREEAAMAIPIMASESGRSPSDVETQQQLGINIHMIESDSLMDDLSKLAERRYRVPIFNDGKLVQDSKGNPLYEERVYFHPVFMALKVHLDKLFSTRYLDPIDVDIAICNVEYEFNKLKMQLSYEEFTQWSSYIEALKRMAISAICDSKKGRKAQLMKITSKGYELRMHSIQEGKKGVMPE